MLQVEAIRAAITRVLTERRDAVVIGSDVALHGGPYRATGGLLAEFGPDRVLDLPRNASAIFGFARGLALAGRDVICEVAPEDALRAATSLARDAERWLGQQGTFVEATYGRRPSDAPPAHAPPGAIVLRIPAFRGSDLESTMASIPGATVFSPARPADAYAAICAGVAKPGTVTVVLEHENLYRGHDDDTSFLGAGDDVGEVAPPLAWRQVRPGRDGTVVTWGFGVIEAAQAAEVLAAEGYAIGVIDLVQLSSLSTDALKRAAETTGRVVVAASTGAGFGAELAYALTRAAFLSLEAPVVVVATERDGPGALVAAMRAAADY